MLDSLIGHVKNGPLFVVGLRMVLEAARVATDRMGAWHIDPGAKNGSCVYTKQTVQQNGKVTVGCTRCYVGEILDILGFPIDTWQGTDMAGGNVESLVSHLTEYTERSPFFRATSLTPAVEKFFQSAQTAQDAGQPWGLAFNAGLSGVVLDTLQPEDGALLEGRTLASPAIAGYSDNDCVKPQEVIDREENAEKKREQAHKEYERRYAVAEQSRLLGLGWSPPGDHTIDAEPSMV